MPHWGGPVALSIRGTDTFEDIYSYGNSRCGSADADVAQEGYSLGSVEDGWTHPL